MNKKQSDFLQFMCEQLEALPNNDGAPQDISSLLTITPSISSAING